MDSGIWNSMKEDNRKDEVREVRLAYCMLLYITGDQNRVPIFEPGSVLRGSIRSVCGILEPFASLWSLRKFNGPHCLPLGCEKMKTEVAFL
jgi:hypothetical protein